MLDNLLMQNKRLIAILAAVALLLCVPLVATLVTGGMGWGLEDFIAAGVLLLGTGLMFEFAARRSSNTAYRTGAAIAVVGALLLVWINLAVGIIGNEGNPANLMYAGVLAVGAVGALVARFQPRGMSNALFAMALAQLMVAAIVIIGRLDDAWLLDLFFAVLWATSGLLFRAAGGDSNGFVNESEARS